MNFHIIKLDDKEEFNALLGKTSYENSEFSFANIFIWRKVYRIKIASLNGVIYIKGACPGTGMDMHYQPIVPDHIPLAGILSEIKTDTGSPSRIYAANKQFVDRIRNESIPVAGINMNRDMFDYVYLTEDLAKLEGKKYHNKRTHINKFMRSYEFVYKELAKDQFDDCIEIFDSWAADMETDSAEEKEAVISALENMEALGLCGAVLYIGRKPVAFTIGEHFKDDTALIHIEKAVPDLAEAYSVINQQFVSRKWQGKVKYINREEDMGIEGLRIAKMSYRPYKFIEKFNIEL